MLYNKRCIVRQEKVIAAFDTTGFCPLSFTWEKCYRDINRVVDDMKNFYDCLLSNLLFNPYTVSSDDHWVASLPLSDRLASYNVLEDTVHVQCLS